MRLDEFVATSTGERAASIFLTAARTAFSSASGRRTVSSAGATSSQPSATACAAAGAESVPANLSGHMSTRTTATYRCHTATDGMVISMATLMQRLQRFLRSPQGQRLVEQGRRQMAKPENQAKARRLLTRLQSKRRY